MQASLFAQEKSIWSTASSSYQVEGSYQADGKGVSNWDAYTNKYNVTESPMFAGEIHTGNDASVPLETDDNFSNKDLSCGQVNGLQTTWTLTKQKRGRLRINTAEAIT